MRKIKLFFLIAIIADFLLTLTSCEEVESEINSVSDYDGNVYKTVKIGSQIWMAENLKTTHYADGTEISLVQDSSSWTSLSVEDKAYCYNENVLNDSVDYGALYTWAAAMNGFNSTIANPSEVQGACPDGWHLPSDAEWIQLELFLGMKDYDAELYQYWRGEDIELSAKLRSTNYWPLGNGNNVSGFNALPAGVRGHSGIFNGNGYVTVFWTTTIYGKYGTSEPIVRLLNGSNYPGVFRMSSMRNNALSVRCVKD